MNKIKRLAGRIGFVLCSVLLGYTTYGQPSVSVGVSVPLPSVQIRVESDFYEPLAPQGEWVVIGSYGRCWRPGHVEAGWRPYCNGSWQRTDAGWYWVSDEPWAWATYHYGRWDFTDQYGWYWVPQIQWAPAWVSWHEGGGYIGWAPLLPSVRVSGSGFIGFNAAVISPRAFVFVEERRFLDPIRPTTVVANNTTIINKTVNITKTKIVNNTVINEGPATAVIEKASGRKVQAVPVRELRQKTEVAVASKQRTPTGTRKKKVEPPVRSEAQPREKKTVAPAPRQVEKAPQVEKPAGDPRESAAPATRNESVDSEKNGKPAKEKPGNPSNEKAQRSDKEKPAASEKNAGNPADKDKDKGQEKNPKD
ncbi:MAG: hypothetical protein HY298_18480 [Verrucomicrobia bacterium]|nr:hypothetical protein [Verrucomicrobiota bacterium]